MLFSVLAISFPAQAQVQIGDNLKMNLNGVMSGGYGGSFGNQIPSSHGLDLSGNGTLSGSYYNPNFLSFSMSPYYGRSQQSSQFLSLFNGGGFDFNSNIFGGSHFPGSVGFSKNWNSQGTFGLPGQPNYTTDSSGQGFSIGWSELVPNYPTLTAVFNTSSSDYTVLGSAENGSSSAKRFSLNSAYSIGGFNLNGFYTLGTSDSHTPEVFGSQAIQNVTSNDHEFGASVSHPLPWQGSFSSSFTRSNMSSDYLGYQFQGTVDAVNANAGFHPTNKLSLSFSSGYNDNLTGSLLQALVPTGPQGGQGGQAGTQTIGGVIENTSESSHSFFVSSYATYQLTTKLLLDGQVERRQQSYLGNSYSQNLYGGGAMYVTNLLGGFMSASLNAVGSNNSYTTGNTLGFSSGVNYSRTFNTWVIAGGFNYSQNVQTVLITYMNSFYNYTGSVRHRLSERYVVSATASGSRSVLTNDPHSGNSSQSYSTSFASRRFSVNGSYAKSDGYGLLGGGQIQPLPLNGIPLDWLILYGGHSYSFGLGATPVRNMTFGASFARAFSNTTTAGVGSTNKTSQLNMILNYRMRKVTLTAGYGRLLQGFSASGLPVSEVNSFSVGLSRSFNIF